MINDHLQLNFDLLKKKKYQIMNILTSQQPMSKTDHFSAAKRYLNAT